MTEKDNELRVLIDLRDRTIQKNRIAFGNRLTAINNGQDEADEKTFAIVERWNDRFIALEEEVDEDIKDLASEYPIIDEMVAVKGVGPMLAAKVVAMIDIDRAKTVSALWRYSGYGVTNGERDKPTKGEKLKYNKRLKQACYLVGGSFLKSNSPYRQIYDSAREYYEANRKDWTLGHQHNAAMRKMVKLWLSHLWLTWRSIEGLETNEPYVHSKLGHEHNYTPEEFGWESLKVI